MKVGWSEYQSEPTQPCHTGAERWSVSVNVIDRDMVH